MKLKNFFKRVGAFFRMFFSKAARFFETDGKQVINFLNGVKEVVENPAISLLIAMSKNQVDDKIYNALLKALTKSIDILQITTECMGKETPELKVQCFIQYLRTCSPELRNAIYHKAASLMTREMAEKKGLDVAKSDIDTLIQLEYSKQKNQ